MVSKGKLVGAIVCGILTVAFGIGSVVASNYTPQLNAVFNADNQRIIPDPDAKIYFWTDYQNEDDLVAYERELCEKIEGEGASLLYNKDNTLPLNKNSKLSCFSHSSVDLIYGGTGSGQVSSADAISLKAALEDSNCFGEGAVNQELWAAYIKSRYKRVNAKTTGGSQDEYRLNEMPWSKIPDKAKNEFANFGDVALMVLSRSGGEGADLPHNNAKLTEYLTEGDYLRLCAEEIELFENLKTLKQQGTFKKIVVLLNSSNAIQIDFINKYDVDAVLWIGDVGMTGINAVADILCGNIVPSGRLVDTFLKDNHSAPAMVNFGAFDYANQAEYSCGTAQSNLDPGITKCNKNYLIYQEGIYVGYRYFETRYEDFVLSRGNPGNFNYDDCVAFPFGYGLSYTDFSYSNFEVEENETNFVVTVDVKNIGILDAKHTVQIYYQSPYTQYDIDNLVEKAAVEICGFDKKEIKAGKTVDYSITIDKKDLTSYDSNNAKTYILEDGDYYFTIGRDAHDAINNILEAKKLDNSYNVDSNKMSGTGNANLTYKWHNDTFDNETYSVSSATGYKITNQFDDVDINKYAGTSEQKVTYLTRNDWVGTYPQVVPIMTINETMWADGLTHTEAGRRAIIGNMIAKYYPDITTLPEMGASNGLSVSDLIEIEITDERWDRLVEQCSYHEMIDLISNGFHMTKPVASINLPGTLDENGPQGFTKGLIGGNSAMCYTSEDVMAATFNLDLLYEMGKCIGEDFFHATPKNANTYYTGIYGPGANIHRTPYSGRNFEYYSEDGFVSAKMAASEVSGIQSKGVYVFTKHFALNDQEEGRYGVSTWSNEQAIREIYLKGFEGSVVEGGGLGVMSSFNRVGVVWAGAHYGLMTEILRNEWGMKGAAITDCSVSATYMHNVMGVLAGQDLWDGNGSSLFNGYGNNPAVVKCCQTATKRIAYSIAHSRAMNIGNATIKVITPWYMLVIYGLIGLSGALTLMFVILFVLRFIKKED